jgi:hypothetical protein
MPKTIQIAAHIALLAPVPLEHLDSGKVIAETEGKVAFGSMKFELFRKLDVLRTGMPVDVYIYASHSDGQRDFEVSWRGRYIGHVVSDPPGAHPNGMKYRPASTANYPNDNSGHWAVFWEIEDLRPLLPEEGITLASFTPFDGKKPYGHAFPPEGPLLIEHPVGVE